MTRRPVLPKPVKLRTKGSLLVPYIELFSGLDAPLPIKSIIVGPHPHQTRQEDAVNMLAEAKGLRFTTRLSAIPFQN